MFAPLLLSTQLLQGPYYGRLPHHIILLLQQHQGTRLLHSFYLLQAALFLLLSCGGIFRQSCLSHKDVTETKSVVRIEKGLCKRDSVSVTACV